MNIKRAKEEIEHTVKAYLAKDALGEYAIPAIRQRPILLMGPPGIGKTQVMEQAARECGVALVAYTITHHTRQSAVGLPFIRQRNYGGRDVSVTEYTMSEIIASVYAKMEATGLKEGVLFIDEINCVSETLAPTMLQFYGDKVYQAIHAFAQGWEQRGLVEKGFLAYVEDAHKVSFPWSMIDKITPRPDASVEDMLRMAGVEDLEPVITGKNTYVAPFVNAEECQYLVIEDNFPNGRPALEEGGVIFTTRETVDRVEKMKVCTCLNPLHTALAVFGCLLGYTLISKEMDNPVLKKLVEVIGYEEGLPVVVNPGVIAPKKFIDEVVNIRIPNPFMPDTPQRIATDTSQKLGIRFGETIKAYQRSGELSVSSLKRIPLVFAGWLRYLCGIDDKGEAFTLSADPMLDTVCPYVADLKFGDTQVHEKVAPILSNEKIFGVNLYEAGLGELTEQYFVEMLAGKGAVEATLAKYV